MLPAPETAGWSARSAAPVPQRQSHRPTGDQSGGMWSTHARGGESGGRGRQTDRPDLNADAA
eukprot:1882089-Alexandrium_andersonii.AAC.1